MKCRWKRIDGCVQCERCGWKSPPVKQQDLRRIHSTCKAFPFWYELGHWLAIFLAAAGITKRRYNWLRVRLGLVKPCGCAKREEKLNSWGARLAAWIAKARHRINNK